MRLYECSSDENGLNEVERVFKDRKCLKCSADIIDTPEWKMGGAPFGSVACVSCPECNRRYSASKHKLGNIDTSEYL